MFDRKKRKRQNVRIYGFKFPQALFDEIRLFQKEEQIQIPASSYAALICVLKQVHREKTTLGEVQEFSLSQYAAECKISYSSLYVGFKFWLKHGFIV